MKEPITVEARLEADGGLCPQSFLWRGRRHTVHSLGRRWEQAGEVRYLVQDNRRRTFELAFEPADGRWSLLRSPRDFGARRPKNAF